jgi:hypothetical protein
VRHSFGARKWTTAPPIPARIRATWTPSGRCGICSISRRRGRGIFYFKLQYVDDPSG